MSQLLNSFRHITAMAEHNLASFGDVRLTQRVWDWEWFGEETKLQVQEQSIIWWNSHIHIGGENTVKHFLSGYRMLEREGRSQQKKDASDVILPCKTKSVFYASMYPQAASTVPGTWKCLRNFWGELLHECINLCANE